MELVKAVQAQQKADPAHGFALFISVSTAKPIGLASERDTFSGLLG